VEHDALPKRSLQSSPRLGKVLTVWSLLGGTYEPVRG
jgi:hypothetical protein